MKYLCFEKCFSWYLTSFEYCGTLEHSFFCLLKKNVRAGAVISCYNNRIHVFSCSFSIILELEVTEWPFPPLKPIFKLFRVQKPKLYGNRWWVGGGSSFQEDYKHFKNRLGNNACYVEITQCYLKPRKVKKSIWESVLALEAAGVRKSVKIVKESYSEVTCEFQRFFPIQFSPRSQKLQPI